MSEDPHLVLAEGAALEGELRDALLEQVPEIGDVHVELRLLPHRHVDGRRGRNRQEGAMYEGSDFRCDVAIPDPGRFRVVHDDDPVLAYHHSNPSWPTHIVVVPKKHIRPSIQPGRALHPAHLTKRSSYQSNKHLHVHVYAGDRLR